MSDETSPPRGSATFSTWTFDQAYPSTAWTPLVPATLTLQAHATVPDLTADLVMVGVVDDDATSDAAAMMADLDVTLTGGALSQVREEHVALPSTPPRAVTLSSPKPTRTREWQ
jgi:hypothetical protein